MPSPALRNILLLLSLSIIGWLTIYWTVLVDMVGVWSGSETYKHCFLILPIVLYLIYERKNELPNIKYKTNPWLLIPIFFSLLIYLVSDLMMINLFSHFSAYVTLVGIIWFVLGNQFVRFAQFPLFFLAFTIPFGEELVPALQQITADISVWIIQIVGVPIYRDGLYLHVPNGSFVVAEACAGIRFLIATIAIGTLYTYLFFKSIKRRTLFMLACFIIPILANGVRAAGIVLVGYYSDMEHAVGADHLVYGWLFFSLVLAMIIIVGQFFQDAPLEANSDSSKSTLKVISYNFKIKHFVLLALCFLLFKAYALAIQDTFESPNKAQTPISFKGYNKTSSVPSQPNFKNPDREEFYQQGNTYLYLAQYDFENQQKELVSWSNRQFNPELLERERTRTITFTAFDKEQRAETLYLTTANGEQFTLTYMYIVGNQIDHRAIPTKLAQLKSKLTGKNGAASMLQLFMPGHIESQQVHAKLEALKWEKVE